MTPTDIAAQALDAMGSEIEISDIEDGSREARVMLRAYGHCLSALLRAAHWDFARKEAPLQLLADATGAGSIPNVAAPIAPVGSIVPGRFRFSYAYPLDCVKARGVPWRAGGAPPAAGNIALPQTPIMTGLGSAFGASRRVPSARFIVSTDVNSPPVPGQEAVAGVSLQGRTVILTDVPDAWLVYTAMMLYPENWDPMFRAAFVSYLAAETVLAVSKDKKFGMAVRREQIAITKAKIDAARVADGNEGTFSTDHVPDWIAGRYGAARGPGVDYGAGWDACSFSDGSCI